MNKQYMDFVPKGKKIPAKKPVKVRKPVPVAEEPEVYATVEEATVIAGNFDEPLAPTEEFTDVDSDVNIEEFFAVDNNPRRRKEPEFGVIEEYNRPKFVQTEVKKRPLGAKPDMRAVNTAKPATKPASDVAAVKAKKIGTRPFVRPAKPVAKPVASAKKTEAPAPEKKNDTLKVPKTRFVNTEKVEKRPLSKNVYKKKIVAPKEEPTGPVTIITKPDKGSHIGVIVTIILTIILGAAAGTVAFLLLPK
jgi:hypothetical protein